MLLVTVLGSALASIDATVASIALPAIGRDFSASLTSLQWVVTSYTLTLAGLLLFAGTLGGRYGRKRIFLTGVVWLALASLVVVHRLVHAVEAADADVYHARRDQASVIGGAWQPAAPVLEHPQVERLRFHRRGVLPSPVEREDVRWLLAP